MRDKVPDVLEKGRVRTDPHFPGEFFGRFVVKGPAGDRLFVIASGADPEGWASLGLPGPPFEHVSVSVRGPDGKPAGRCPTWEEMCFVKGLCWRPDECVVQYHPPEAEYVNHHPHCLHLWKPVGVEVPRPPAETVGPRAVP